MGVRKRKTHLNTAKFSFDCDVNTHKLCLCGFQNLEKSQLFCMLSPTLESEGGAKERSRFPGEVDEGRAGERGFRALEQEQQWG